MVGTSYWPNPQSWKHYWPAGVVAAIAVIQLPVSFAIVGLQSAIVGIGVGRLCNSVTPRYVMGFVCWVFFFAGWISIFCVTCCNRSSVCCATYTLVKNILVFIFSCVLIDFDRQFIYNPLFDYNYNPLFDYNNGQNQISNTCNPYYDTDSIDSVSTTTNWLNISVALTKGQLAGAVIMLVTSLAFVGIYIYVYIRALRADGRMSGNTFESQNRAASNQNPAYVPRQPGPMIVQQKSALYTPEPRIDYSPNNNTSGSRNNPQTVICHKCGAMVDVNERF